MWKIIIALIFLSLNACASTSEVNLMSFNLRYGLAEDGDNHWRLRQHLVTDVIQNKSPDILGVQEALGFQLNDIIQKHSSYTYVGEGRDGGEKGEFSAILYKKEKYAVQDSGTFWLSDTPAIPSSHWGNEYLRICTWVRFLDKKTSRAFYVFNTHLDHKSQRSREKSVSLIKQKISQRQYKEPYILMGDFNAGENNQATRYLLAGQSDQFLVDSFRKRKPNTSLAGTFNGFAGEKTGEKIDYILVSPSIRVMDADIVYYNVDGRYPSDHYPVTARIGF